MQPPLNVKLRRKKVRNLKRKCRRPFSSIIVGAYLVKLEQGEVVKSLAVKKEPVFDRIAQASRYAFLAFSRMKYSEAPNSNSPITKCMEV